MKVIMGQAGCHEPKAEGLHARSGDDARVSWRERQLARRGTGMGANVLGQ